MMRWSGDPALTAGAGMKPAFFCPARSQMATYLAETSFAYCGISPSHFRPSAAHRWFLYCSGLLEASLQQMLQQVASVSELVQASGM